MTDLLPEGRNASVDSTSLTIGLEPVPAADILAGQPRQGTASLGTIAGAALGIWELRDGTVTDTEVDEFFVVLSGGATIELLEVPGSPDEAGRVVEVGPGDSMRLVAGTRTQWTVADHIRKVYIAEA